jgi:hypothetical protein
MTNQIIRDANQLTSQRLISHYLPSPDSDNVWTHEGACLSARRVANRYGAPPDATTWRYVVQHPEFGWSYAIRAVWRSGKLMPPLATHVIVECYCNDDETQLPDEAAAVVAINEWLCSL